MTLLHQDMIVLKPNLEMAVAIIFLNPTDSKAAMIEVFVFKKYVTINLRCLLKHRLGAHSIIISGIIMKNYSIVLKTIQNNSHICWNIIDKLFGEEFY